jgi:hypothetical protein
MNECMYVCVCIRYIVSVCINGTDITAGIHGHLVHLCVCVCVLCGTDITPGIHGHSAGGRAIQISRCSV